MSTSAFFSGSPTAMKLGKTTVSGAILLACLLTPTDLQAGAFDWLGSKRPEGKSRPLAKPEPVRASASNTNSGATADGLPGFFKSETAVDPTGTGLSPLKFAETHWMNARKNLEAVTKNISAKIPAKRCTDISEKLFVIDTQIVRESLKNSGGAVEKLLQGTRTLEGVATDLNRIITAPREETLANLEKTVANLQNANEALFRQTKASITGAESLVQLAQEAYQTLELIPLLSLGPIDYYVQGSKQLMKKIQSDNEALKGLLLNIQSSSEQLVSGLEIMISTLKSSLRYSDHFAFRQYPLVNLPVPSREKLFSQLGTIQNIIKGMGNTLSIGNSHVKNSAQQFSHLFESMNAKIRDSLQYLTAVDVSSGNLPQISVYAQNQIFGLFQRTKDSIAAMHLEMAKTVRSTPMGGAPQIAMESREDATVRRSAGVAEKALPLFLLGGKSGSVRSNQTVAARHSTPTGTSQPGRGATTVLFTERRPVADPLTKGFRPEEMEILEKELGSPGLLTKDPAFERPANSSNDLAFLEETPQAENDLLKSFSPMPQAPLARMSRENRDADQLDLPQEKTDIDLLPMDIAGINESGDLIPMMRMDEPLSAHDGE